MIPVLPLHLTPYSWLWLFLPVLHCTSLLLTHLFCLPIPSPSWRRGYIDTLCTCTTLHTPRHSKPCQCMVICLRTQFKMQFLYRNCFSRCIIGTKNSYFPNICACSHLYLHLDKYNHIYSAFRLFSYQTAKRAVISHSITQITNILHITQVW